MKTKHYLTLEDAEFLLTRAHQYAIDQKFNVSIAVVDETGTLLAMKRMDGASPMTANLSIEKPNVQRSVVSQLYFLKN